jgi:transposase-like protein
MSQHFLLSAAARTLSLTRIMRMTDDEARDTFKRVRWAANGGEPSCPHCGCLTIYTLAEMPPRWKCGGCRRKFSLTSGTLFHSRKLPVRDYLAIIALFVNGVKGTSALQISRDLDINPKSAFVLLHKLREAMGSQIHNSDQPELSGEVQIDGAYFGGHIKPENRKADRGDRRLVEEQTGKRQVVVVAREVRGRTLPFVVPRESEAVPLIRQHVASGTISMLTNRMPGSGCTRPMTCAASTTQSSTRPRTRRTSTKPSRTSQGCDAPRLVSIIGSAAICSNTRMRQRGAKITAASQTARTGTRSSVRRLLA